MISSDIVPSSPGMGFGASSAVRLSYDAAMIHDVTFCTIMIAGCPGSEGSWALCVAKKGEYQLSTGTAVEALEQREVTSSRCSSSSIGAHKET